MMVPTPRRLMIMWQYVYETRLAPYLAIYGWWIWWPLYRFLKKNNVCFVVNIAEGTGHVLPELDNFFRQLRLGEIDPRKKYIWLRTRNDFSRACVALYGHQFARAYESNLLYDFLLPILLKFHDVTHDAGTSALYWQLPKKGMMAPAKPWQTYLHMGTKQEAHRLWLEYYRRRSETADFVPLHEFGGKALKPDAQLRAFLKEEPGRLALIHIKTNIMNATAAPTDPATYMPALHCLLNQGFTLVFVGREEMPDLFRGLPMLNYAQSSVASFVHDLQLFALADVSVVGGSGIAWIADCLDKPVLYLNSWHMFMPPFSRKCIYVPTLALTKDGQLLSFKEQFELHYTGGVEKGDIFPIGDYQPVNANAADILHGLQELLADLKGEKELTLLQEDFRRVHAGSWMKYAHSRMSDSFVKKYTHLLR
ncbi:MAG: TIGR04372 family glycosyltransferase [Candidatus Andersenbacteria bacterium]|nr:TIGR04372 family glycosyltransferase [Candidatus Andersenbacteria bacterium]